MYLFSHDQTAIWKLTIEFLISDNFSWIWHNLLTRYSLLLTPCAVSGRNNECKRTRDSFNSHQRIQESAIITLLYGSRKQCCQLCFLVIKRPPTYLRRKCLHLKHLFLLTKLCIPSFADKLQWEPTNFTQYSITLQIWEKLVTLFSECPDESWHYQRKLL